MVKNKKKTDFNNMDQSFTDKQYETIYAVKQK